MAIDERKRHDIASQKTKHTCPECGKAFAGRANKKFCSEACGHRHWEHRHPARSRNTDGQQIITVAQVRKAEGLTDKPKPPHVCRFYPPSYKCLCGKQGCGPARTYRMVTFQPATQQTAASD
jgi:predicted nucleic acid-binding Zn ribbon protein